MFKWISNLNLKPNLFVIEYLYIIVKNKKIVQVNVKFIRNQLIRLIKVVLIAFWLSKFVLLKHQSLYFVFLNLDKWNYICKIWELYKSNVIKNIEFVHLI